MFLTAHTSQLLQQQPSSGICSVFQGTQPYVHSRCSAYTTQQGRDQLRAGRLDSAEELKGHSLGEVDRIARPPEATELEPGPLPRLLPSGTMGSPREEGPGPP